MRYAIIQRGESRSFPAGDAFLAGASAGGEVAIHLGTPVQADDSKAAILVELGSECLGVHTGEAAGIEGSNVLGFARYRNGADAPSKLV
jgi:3-hydroxybutyryl-CoA dehydrogenase